MLPLRSAFSSLTFLLLLVSVAIFAVPSMAEETVPFSRSGRVVDRRVPRSLKHYRPRRPIAAPLDSRTYGDNQGGNGYGSSGNDNNGHGYGGDNGYGGSNDNGNHGGYGSGSDNGSHGGDNGSHGGYGGDNGSHGGYGGGNNGGYGGGNNGGYGGGNNGGYGGNNGGYDGGNNGGYGGGHNGGYGGGGYQPPVYGHPSQSPPKPTPTPYQPPSHGSHGY